MTEYDDDRLEAEFRDGLQRLADGTDVSTPVAASARAAARRRRQSRIVMGVAAASVAVVGITGFVVSRDGTDSVDGPVVDSPTQPGPEVTEWRTEYWHNLQVDIPADWAYGAAPFDMSGDLIRCGGPDDGSIPYVGRPISLTDVCSMVKHLDVDAPYVWLGAEIEPGTVDLGGGYTQETVEIAGTTLTVASDDAGLRSDVLDSAGVGELCPAQVRPPLEGRSENTDEGLGDFQQAHVCAYDDETNHLVAAAPMRQADFAAMEAALEAAPQDLRQCKSPGELVVVTGWYADPYSDERELWLRHDRVFELGCGVVDLGDQMFGGPSRVRATDEAVDAWRSELYETTLYHFIGPLG